MQATARDILVDAMLAVEAAGYPIVLHVHDELVVEREADEGSLDEVLELMKIAPPWAAGCPIDVEGYEAQRYRK